MARLLKDLVIINKNSQQIQLNKVKLCTVQNCVLVFPHQMIIDKIELDKTAIFSLTKIKLWSMCVCMCVCMSIYIVKEQ